MLRKIANVFSFHSRRVEPFSFQEILRILLIKMEVPLSTSFHGYPTCFDVPTNSWKPLCEGACTVDVHTTPPTIYLKALDGTVRATFLVDTVVWLICLIY